MIKKLSKFFANDYVAIAFLFILAVVVRSIPNIKAGQWVIGYDTFNTYVAELTGYHGSLINWLKTANILYFIFLPFKLIGLKSDVIVKLFGPLLFGGLVVSFYFWARQFVKFDKIKALLASLLIIFQLASLRLSWDLYRNELGLIFLFLALINLTQIKKTKNLVFACLFSVLVGLSNELVTALLLVILLFYLVNLLIKKQYNLGLRIVLLLIFLAGIFWMVVSSSKIVLYDPHIIFISGHNNVFWRYFYIYNNDMSYQQLTQTVMTLFRLYYQFLLPLVLLGFWLLRKNFILLILTLWLLIGTFSSFIFLGKGLIVWDRWLVMLIFPFVIYATEGASFIGKIISQKLKKWHSYFLPVLWTLAVIFWLGFIGLFIWRAIPFLSADYKDAKPPLANEVINSYFPRTMVHNSIGLAKIDDNFQCVKWLNDRVPSGAVVLVDNRWRGLMMTNFEMDNRYIITNNWSDSWSKNGLEFAQKKGFKDIYMIWNSGRINGFDRIFVSGNVAVYKAK